MENHRNLANNLSTAYKDRVANQQNRDQLAKVSKVQLYIQTTLIQHMKILREDIRTPKSSIQESSIDNNPEQFLSSFLALDEAQEPQKLHHIIDYKQFQTKYSQSSISQNIPKNSQTLELTTLIPNTSTSEHCPLKLTYNNIFVIGPQSLVLIHHNFYSFYWCGKQFNFLKKSQINSALLLANLLSDDHKNLIISLNKIKAIKLPNNRKKARVSRFMKNNGTQIHKFFVNIFQYAINRNCRNFDAQNIRQISQSVIFFEVQIPFKHQIQPFGNVSCFFIQQQAKNLIVVATKRKQLSGAFLFIEILLIESCNQNTSMKSYSINHSKYFIRLANSYKTNLPIFKQWQPTIQNFSSKIKQ